MAGSESFGRLMQLGHVVPNLADAIQYWLDRGVGPFYEMTHVRLAKQVYRGAPTDIDMGVAISYSGSLQIELIVQHNDSPSLYKDFLEEHPEGGLHHLAFITETMDEAIARAGILGTPVVQHWTDQLGGRYAYLEPQTSSESYIELLEATPTLLGFFEQIEKASRFWDGAEPHRIVGQ